MSRCGQTFWQKRKGRGLGPAHPARSSFSREQVAREMRAVIAEVIEDSAYRALIRFARIRASGESHHFRMGRDARISCQRKSAASTVRVQPLRRGATAGTKPRGCTASEGPRVRGPESAGRSDKLAEQHRADPLPGIRNPAFRVVTISMALQSGTYRTACARTSASASDWPAAQRGLRPWHVRKLLAREPGDRSLDRPQALGSHGPWREGDEP